MFASGARYRPKQIFKIAVADFVMAVLFVWYLIAAVGRRVLRGAPERSVDGLLRTRLNTLLDQMM